MIQLIRTQQHLHLLSIQTVSLQQSGVEAAGETELKKRLSDCQWCQAQGPDGLCKTAI